MKISNYTTIAGEKVKKINCAAGEINEIIKEGGVGFKFRTQLVLKSKIQHKNKDHGLSI